MCTKKLKTSYIPLSYNGMDHLTRVNKKSVIVQGIQYCITVQGKQYLFTENSAKLKG